MTTSPRAAGPKPESGERNTFHLPRGEPLRRALRAAFAEQRRAIVGYLRTGRRPTALIKGAFVSLYDGTKDHAAGQLPAAWPDWHDFGMGALDLSRRMAPFIAATWDAAGAKFTSKIGLDPDEWSVTSPHLAAMIDAAALAFSESMNATTSKTLAAALADTRQALHEGVVAEGESIEQLTKRINAIFDSAEKWRARRIAQTETSRAVHAAQEQAAIASGVVTGWEWLLSGDACPKCIAVAARAPAVRLGRPFAVIGDNPHYSRVKFPPLHPHCNCSVNEVLDTDPQPEWSGTLHDPAPATDDEHRAVAGRTQARDDETLGGRPKPKKPPAAAKPAPAKKPAAAAKPRPAKKPRPPAWRWGEPIDPDRPIAERIRTSPAWERTKELAGAHGPYRAAYEAAEKAKQAFNELQDLAILATVKDRATDEEKADLLRRIQAASEEAKRLRKARDEAKVAANGHTGRLLLPPKRAKAYAWDIDRSDVGRDNKATVANAEQFVSGLVAAGRGDAYRNWGGITTLAGDKLAWKTIPPAEEQRAHCRDWKNEVWLSGAESSAVAVHEWGHQIEHSVPGVRAATVEFLKHRVGNEPLRKLGDIFPDRKYKDDERGREDDFRKAFGDDAWYVGKDYHGASEIISMGLQKLYDDPGGFAHADPEYCAFILGILDGSLRKP